MRKGKRLVSAVLTVAMLVMTAAGLSTTAFAQTFSVDTLVECEAGELSNDIETVEDAAASGGTYIMAGRATGSTIRRHFLTRMLHGSLIFRPTAAIRCSCGRISRVLAATQAVTRSILDGTTARGRRSIRAVWRNTIGSRL